MLDFSGCIHVKLKLSLAAFHIFFSARFIRNSIFLVHIFSAENLVNSNPIITTLAFMKRL